MYSSTRVDRYTFMAACTVLWIAITGSLVYALSRTATSDQLVAAAGIIVGSAGGAAISIFTKRIMSIWDDCFEIMQKCINTLTTQQARLDAFRASIIFVSKLIKLERRFYLLINALTTLMLAAAIIFIATSHDSESSALPTLVALIVGTLGGGAVAITTNQILRVWSSYSRQLKTLVSENLQ